MHSLGSIKSFFDYFVNVIFIKIIRGLHVLMQRKNLDTIRNFQGEFGNNQVELKGDLQ